MHLISHRRNTLQELRDTPRHYGVEIDLRSQGKDLILHHDAFMDGENFEAWIASYAHGTLILNVKEEGLERRLLEIMDARGIKDFFFLDQSFPFLVRTTRTGERRCAVRVSEFEQLETALTLTGKADWIWVDCFTRFPLTQGDASTLKKAGFKLCLVSPELQGRSAETEIPAMRRLLAELGIEADAACTKRPDLWEQPL